MNPITLARAAWHWLCMQWHTGELNHAMAIALEIEHNYHEDIITLANLMLPADEHMEHRAHLNELHAACVSMNNGRRRRHTAMLKWHQSQLSKIHSPQAA
ncbi:hypothetical protein [Chitinolyticbacter meiyuanensis]|uniref:hypothetical protein n=1 Tax=Chitinolyticbacter meiyuanensis TaxID=682798 RepID=UPI0011E5EA3B|nr:hypothetical protein [Chitinolyticbacter meiyuanensis]